MEELHNTPDPGPHTPATPLVGREDEVAALALLLERDGSRLITLTGPRGAGKTRLALHVAVEVNRLFADGVTVAILAALTDRDLVISTIGHALGVEDNGQRPLLQVVQDYLRDRHLLLVIDTAEQAIDHAPVIAELLAMAPRMKIMVSNRTALLLPGEHEFKVAALALPDLADLPPVDALDQYSAIRLFVERSKAADPGFGITLENSAAVVEICSRLEGLPLGIELVAARCTAGSPQAIWPTLEPYLRFQSPGARDMAERQQTLRATLDWTYDLLPAAERQLAALAALFPGGATPAALATVWADAAPLQPAIEGLEQSGWLQPDTAAGRWSMLDTMREYALERLEDRAEAAVGRWLGYYLGLVEQAEAELTGSQQAVWLERLAGEYVNIRAALRRAIDQRQSDAGLRMAAGLWRFWLMRGYVGEGRRWLEAALGLRPDAPFDLRARALNGLGTLASIQGDYEAAKNCFTGSLAMQQVLGNAQGIGFALNNLGLVASEQGEYAQAASLLSESLAVWRELADRRQMAITLSNLGVIAIELGDYALAASFLEESLALWRELENSWGVAIGLINLGEALAYQGDYGRASAFLEEGLLLCKQVGDMRLLTAGLLSLGHIATDQADYARAGQLLGESLTLCQQAGDKRGLARTLEAGAGLLAASAQRAPQVPAARQAAYLLGVAENLRETMGTPLPPADRQRYIHTLGAIQAALPAPALAEAWAAGRSAQLDEVVRRGFILQEHVGR